MRFLVAVLVLLLASTAGALAEKRVALVIGNANYVNAQPLKNPANDAVDLAAALTRLGFDVLMVTDVDQTEMRRTVKEFADRLVGADVAMFFYAGHAVQVGGQNYLAPIDTDLERESDLDFETISIDFVQRQMEREAKTHLVFLDACRNNPLTRQLLSRSRALSDTKGLAPSEASGEGTFIAYATQPDNVALDGEGRNSPFTKALLANIERPGIEISTLMTDVRRSVYETTGGTQLPWINSSLLGHFYFNPEQPEKTASPENAARLDKLARLEADARLWDKVKDSRDAGAIRSVLEQLDEGPYAELARSRLAALEAAAPAKKEEAPVADEKPAEVASVEPPKPAVAEIEAEPDRATVRSIQRELSRLGCSPGSADGLWGSRSRSALSSFAQHGDVELASLEPTNALLEQLGKREGRVCPLVCGRGQVERDGQCVAAAPPPKPSKTANAARRVNRVDKSSSKNCFRFNGQMVCE